MKRVVQSRGATLKDISKALNVSSTTVHRALYGKEGISDSLRQKVLQTAQEMGYSLNYAASSMKRKANRFAVVLPAARESGGMYFAYLWKGYRACLAQVAALNIVVDEFEVEDEDAQARVLREIADAGSDKYSGVLTFSYTKAQEVLTQYTRLGAQKISVMVLDDRIEGIDGVFSVTPSEDVLGSLCAEFLSLTTEGEGTIILSGGRADSQVHQRIKKSFREYLDKNRPLLKLVETHAYRHGESTETTYQEFYRFFTEIQDIKGVFAVCSRANAPLKKALEDTGKTRSFRVVGSDLYQESADYLREGMFDAILYKSAYEKGFKAFQVLTDYMIKHVTPPEEISCTVNMIFKSNLVFYEDMIRL